MNQLAGTQDRESAVSAEGGIPQQVLDALRASDPQVRISTLDEWFETPSAAALDTLIDLARDDPSLEVRQAALSTLGELLFMCGASASDPEAEGDVLVAGDDVLREDVARVYQFLLSVYRDEHRAAADQRGAVEALSLFSNETVETAIAELYSRPDKASKVSALVSMGRNGSSRWLGIIRKDLYHPDRDLQLVTVRAAGEFGVDALGPELLHLTYAEDRSLMLAALWSLGQTGWDGAYDRLDECSMDPDPEIRRAADQAMDEWLFYNGLDADGPDDEADDPDDLFDLE